MNNLSRALQFLFGMRETVNRSSYLKWGFGLMLLKLVLEVVLYWAATAQLVSPLQFLSPFVSQRYPNLQTLPDWYIPTVVLTSLPFVWIGAGMSIRRSADAGLSPWFGIGFFVPGLNYILFLLLSFCRSSARQAWAVESRSPATMNFRASLAFVLGLAALGTLLTWLSTNHLTSYGSSLFFASPLVLGLLQSYFLGWKTARTWRQISFSVVLTIALIHLLLLVFALEGIICLAMSLPLSVAMALIGAAFGTAIANFSSPKKTGPVMLVLLLPGLSIVEKHWTPPVQDSVVSTVEVAALPEQVWPHVVKFSDLPPANEWLFKLGVAHPLRARIEGQGVGAVRRCEFSTGAFIEPITVWEAPHHLAFDVRYQPQPLREVSFYDHVDAPHLNGYFRSVRGEFRLTQTPDGLTRLEGQTWYEMEMHPGWYWQLYGRWFIHQIHLRVLNHIKNLTEAELSIRH